jgi:hypothetical protein
MRRMQAMKMKTRRHRLEMNDVFHAVLSLKSPRITEIIKK